ncbi:WD40 repeat-like protein [Sanghuangporus baumii]|uniref:WD40 repeat-like protein n=1 Tax=Sanghuangporus baumii TaxID=108892 RepID=A0A9Q5I5J7_SANBA|nr:WD40 repeat-like protein [Sanghuangporus baumii]
MSTRYSLEVIGARSWVPDHLIHDPDLYVELKIDPDLSFRTKTIKGDVAPQWNEHFTFQSSVVIGLNISLNCESAEPGSTCIGTSSVPLTSLLETLRGEAMLEVRSPAGQRVTGMVSIRLEFSRNQEKETDDIFKARKAIEQLTFSNSGFADCILKATDIVSDIFGDTEIKSITLRAMINIISLEVALIDDGLKKFAMKIARTTSTFPMLFLLAGATALLLKRMSNQIRVERHVIDLVHLVEDIFDFFECVDKIPEKIIYLQSKIAEFLKEVEDFCNFVAGYSAESFIERLFECGLGQKVDNFRKRFNELRNSLQQGVVLQTNFDNACGNSREKITFLRHELKPAEMDASSRPICLAGTRTEILEEVYRWLFSAKTKKAAAENVLWLNGPAGCGKSTISMTISERCLSMGQRGAYLFFERDHSQPNSVIRTIAFRLACFNEAIRDKVVKAVESNNGIASSSLHTQFKKLLLEPLSAAKSSIRGPVIIIIDGLDKLTLGHTRDELLLLIREEFLRLPSTFRFLVTSHPDLDLLWILTHPLTRRSLHHISLSDFQTVTRNDISRYIDHEMHRIIDTNNLQDWPWDENMELLSRAADGCFLWASLAVKHVRSRIVNPVAALEDLLSYCRFGDRNLCRHMQAGLSDLYHSVLTNSGISWDDDHEKEYFSRVLGLIIHAQEPLSISAIDGTLELPLGSSSRSIVFRLQSVLIYNHEKPDAPIRIFHKSFSDYLTSTDAATEPWAIPS